MHFDEWSAIYVLATIAVRRLRFQHPPGKPTQTKGCAYICSSLDTRNHIKAGGLIFVKFAQNYKDTRNDIKEGGLIMVKSGQKYKDTITVIKKGSLYLLKFGHKK